MTDKKVTKRKTATRKAKPKSVFEMLEDSVVGKPIKVANRTFLASLGLVSTMQTEFTKFQTDFEKKFEKLVKDGEKARNRYRKEFKGFREDVKDFGEDIVDDVKDFGEDFVDDVVEVKGRVVKNVRAATD